MSEPATGKTIYKQCPRCKGCTLVYRMDSTLPLSMCSCEDGEDCPDCGGSGFVKDSDV